MVYDLFPFCLHICIQWSKNILEERHRPSQIIILGLNQLDFCILLNIWLYLECMFPTEVNDEWFVNYFGIAKKHKIERELEKYKVTYLPQINSNQTLGMEGTPLGLNEALVASRSVMVLMQGEMGVDATTFISDERGRLKR